MAHIFAPLDNEAWIPLFRDRAVILRIFATMSRIPEFATPRWFSWKLSQPTHHRDLSTAKPIEALAAQRWDKR
jgi:hypothetical protein